MKNLSSFPVHLFIFVTHLIFHGSEPSDMSNLTTLLWLKAEAGVSPLDLWANSSYSNASTILDFSLERLLSADVTVFRSGKIDNWSVRKPYRLRLLFLSETGSPLIMHEFNSSYANSTDWFSAANLLRRSLPSSEQFNISYDLDLISLSRLEVTFGVHSQRDGVFGLYAGALKYNTNQYFLFSSNGSLLYLPGRNFICKQQLLLGSFEFPMMQNFTYNRWDLCSSFCRMHNFIYSFLYNTSCGCDNNMPPTGQLLCKTPCPGNSLEPCGYLGKANSILESEVNVSAFNPNTFDETTWTFQGTDLIDLGRPFYFRNGSITVPDNVTAGSNLTLELSYKLVACNDSHEDFHIKTINITINDSTTSIPFGETIGIVCARLKLEGTAGIVNYNVTLKSSYIKGPAFLTAPILAVQASWGKCDCDCRMYHLLYGDSPYKNMTYAEKEQALQDTITKMKKILTVNKTALSANIRKKTSAQDSRVSAVVMGYTLGVVFLCCSLGLIILVDLPRLYEGFRTLIRNLTER